MQAGWIAQVFAKMPPEQEVIAHWWTKEDVEMNGGYTDAEESITDDNWEKIVTRMANNFAEQDLVETIDEVAKDFQPIQAECTYCGRGCHCDADYENQAGK
jgi:hypothetical protein